MLRTVLCAGVLVVSSAACGRAKAPAETADGEAGQARGAQRAELDAGSEGAKPAPSITRDASTEATAPEAAGPHVPPADGRPELWDEAIATACRSAQPLCLGRGCRRTLATLLQSEQSRTGRSPAYVDRHPCEDAAGTKYTVLRSSGPPGRIHLFRADTGELVSSILMDDVPLCSTEGGATSNFAIFGAFIPECTWFDYDATEPCTDVDAPDVHALETCYYRFLPKPIYAPDGGLTSEWEAPVYPSVPAADGGAR